MNRLVSRIGCRKRRRNSGTAGVAAVELALVLPFFVTLFLGIADFSNAYHQELQLSTALAATATYAFTQGQTESGTTLTTDVSGFLTKVSPVTLTTASASYNNGLVATSCYCVSGATPTYTLATCGSTCADNATAGKFVSITGAITYSPIATFTRAFFASPLTQTVTVRLQ